MKKILLILFIISTSIFFTTNVFSIDKEKYLKMGENYLADGKIELAEKTFQYILKLENTTTNYNKIAYLYSVKNNKEKSLFYYKKSLELDNSSDNSANEYITYVINDFMSKKNYSKAILICKNNLFISPNSFPLNFKLAEIYYLLNDKKNYNKYLEKAFSIIDYDDYRKKAFIESFCNNLLAKKKYYELISLYKKYIKADPYSFTAHIKLGYIYTVLKDFSEAKKYLFTTLEDEEDDNTLYHHYLYAYYLEIIKNIPNNKINQDKIKNYFYLSQYYLSESCYSANFYEYSDDNLEDHPNYNSYCCYSKKDIDPFIEKYKYLAFSLDNYFSLALDYYKEEKYNEAEESIKEFLRLNPKVVIAYNILGDIYKITKKYDLALENYEIAIKLDNSFSKAYSNIADIYKIRKNYIKEKEYYIKAFNLDKTNKEAKDYVIGLNLKYINSIYNNKDINTYKKLVSTYSYLIYLKANNMDFYLKRAEYNFKLANFKDFEKDIKIVNSKNKYDNQMKYKLNTFYNKNSELFNKNKLLNKDIKDIFYSANKITKEACKLKKIPNCN